DDVEGLHAFELDPKPPGTLPRLVEGEGRDGVPARGSAATAAAAHHAAHGHAHAGADTASHAPEAAPADPDADGAAVAAAARRLGELDGLGIEQCAVGLHDLRAFETTATRVDLDAQAVGGDAVGRGYGRAGHRCLGLVGEVGGDGSGRRCGRRAAAS